MSFKCPLPWRGMHITPKGEFYPCCLSYRSEPFGNTHDNTLKELWNSEQMKEMRLDMVNGRVPSQCGVCKDKEDIGAFSPRYGFLKEFPNQEYSCNPDGSIDEYEPKYIDLRLSNLCNLKCRTCGPNFSSLWHDDAVKLFGPSFKNEKVLEPTDDPDDLWEQIEEILPSVESVYFAGGEPLIMESHYKIMNWFKDHGKTDVRVLYNTNFSIMKYKKQDAIELWSHFNNIRVHASLDASGDLAEMMRKGTDWEQVVKNRERMRLEAPNVQFQVSATISIFNVFEIPNFHKWLVTNNWIPINGFRTNILLDPEYFRTQILNHADKMELVQIYNDHKNWIMKFPHFDWHKNDAWEQLSSIIRFTNDADMTHLQDRCKDMIGKLDDIRSERAIETSEGLKRI